MMTEKSGFILIDKEIGISSAKTLYPIKKMLPRGCKVGHGGTLDPFASGLLIAAIGRATRALEYIVGMEKIYQFTVKWGIETDTDDLTGNIVKTSDHIPSLREIEEAIESFKGNIAQTPPKFSAININGERAYDLARNGIDFNLTARQVFVKELIVTSHNNIETSLIMECGKGCYVRSIARDIAYKLGTYSHVTALRRTRTGNFNIGNASSRIIPVTEAFNHYPKVYIEEDIANKIINGIKINVTNENMALIISDKNVWIKNSDKLKLIG